MSKIEIYTTSFCPFCVRAKTYLKSKNLEFTEHNMDGKEEELNALKEKTGWRTVPQIFIDGKLIGGFQELTQLDLPS